MNRMLSIGYPLMGGAAGMAVLVAAAAYVSPVARCVNEHGTVWVSAPVSRCYPITAFVPASAFTPAR